MATAQPMGLPWRLGAGQDRTETDLWSVLAAVLLVLVSVGASLQLGLGLHRAIIVSTCRCVVQMMLLAYYLVPLFDYDRWWLTLVYMVVMLLVASIETVSRPAAVQQGILKRLLVIMSATLVLALLYAIFAALRPRPWYDVRQLYPAAGVLLATMISGVSLGLSTAAEELTVGRDKLELLLGVGASRWEAARGVVQRSVATAVSPAFQQMSVVGIVTLPEFMSGQLAAGASTLQAAKFQIVVMLLAATATTLASAAAVCAEVLMALDGGHRLLSDRLAPRAGSESGVAQWIHAQTVKGWNAVTKRYHRMVTRVRVSLGRGAGSYRSRGRGPNWLMRSSLGQRVFRTGQGEEYDEVGSLDSRLRGVVAGPSDDEQESVLSGVVSEGDDSLAFGRGPSSAGDGDARRTLLATPRRSSG